MEPQLSPDARLAGALPLESWGLIAARGPDAGSFLQGQLTQDVLTLGENEARLAGYCSAKGRLLATFVVLRGQADEWWLACSADLLAPTLKRLSMFVLRARCRLVDARAEQTLWGLVGPSVAAACAGDPGAALTSAGPPAPGTVVRLPGRIVVRLADADGAPRALALQAPGAPAPPGPALAPPDWEACEVRSAVVRVQARTVEQFVPQMVNFEAVGGVNFRKGCFPGQEVVARSQYRGTLKRRAYLYAVQAAAQPGDEIYAADDPGQPAGTVALAAPSPGQAGRWELLAETKIAAAEGSSLRLHTAQGPELLRLPLPYELPAEG
ncbi:MAG: YgfZ/GcvT domain-containing protein [Rubrivivax sp.]